MSAQKSCTSHENAMGKNVVSWHVLVLSAHPGYFKQNTKFWRFQTSAYRNSSAIIGNTTIFAVTQRLCYKAIPLHDLRYPVTIQHHSATDWPLSCNWTSYFQFYWSMWTCIYSRSECSRLYETKLTEGEKQKAYWWTFWGLNLTPR